MKSVKAAKQKTNISAGIVVRTTMLCFLLLASAELSALTRKVLFLGNSYTYFNNLPQLIKDLALSAGDTLIFDTHAPGGYQLQDHALDNNSLNKIKAGGWHYVVMQGQSQEPIAFNNQFTNGGMALYKYIRQYNPCAVVMTYMTWGRKNGDATFCASFPVMCTYAGMDSTLRQRYISLTTIINGEIAPVSAVWRNLRQNNPGIDLYQADGSHPSLAGSYAAACCFYSAIFKKDPTLITEDSGLPSGDASSIRSAAKTEVFNQLPAWNFKKMPVSAFKYNILPGNYQVAFSAVNTAVQQTYYWDFGDGTHDSTGYAVKTFSGNGTYTITLTTTNCDLSGLHTSTRDTVIQFCAHTPSVYSSKAWLCNSDTLWTQQADAYQWVLQNTLLPETKQYLANFTQYGISGFGVYSTVSGCTELSQLSTQTPEWSGYYFDLTGDPCAGDTVVFSVLSANGPLTGSEKILWYRNSLELQSNSDNDTLRITGSGKYLCKVTNPYSNCPLDTTWYEIEYDCGEVPDGLSETGLSAKWTVFPNPCSGQATIKGGGLAREQIAIYNAIGHCVYVVELFDRLVIDISDLPQGLYFLRSIRTKQGTLKLIKE